MEVSRACPGGLLPLLSGKGTSCWVLGSPSCCQTLGFTFPPPTSRDAPPHLSPLASPPHLTIGPATSPFPPSGPCPSVSCFSRHPVGARPQSGVEMAFPVGVTSVRLLVSPRHAHRAPSLPTWHSRSRPGVGGVRGAPSAAGAPRPGKPVLTRPVTGQVSSCSPHSSLLTTVEACGQHVAFALAPSSLPPKA